jgi:hypothetical protein
VCLAEDGLVRVNLCGADGSEIVAWSQKGIVVVLVEIVATEDAVLGADDLITTGDVLVERLREGRA